MPPLTERDKRTLRLAAVGISIYLILFFGWRGWRQLESRRVEYQDLLLTAQRMQREVRQQENKVLLTAKLKSTLRFDPQTLSRASLVGDASAAIQKAASAGGIQLGPIRESPARGTARELASMQLEGAGPIPAVMGLLYRLETLGFPLVVDAIQFTPDTKPGQVKVSLTIVILDYDQWRREEMPSA